MQAAEASEAVGLTFEPVDGVFWLSGVPDARAREAGLTPSRSARTARGEKMWFTGDYEGGPLYNPYAVLPFWDVADAAARERLASIKRDYDLSWARDTGYEPPVPDGKELMPFQRAGVEYVLSKPHALIGDEPGLGKTMQAIATANAMDARRVLVVCPASIRRQWQEKIYEWSVLTDVSAYPVMKAADGVSPCTDYVVVSYDLLRNGAIHEAICEDLWDLVVLDEAHFLKTPDAGRTRAVFGGGRGRFKDHWIARRTGKVLGLTGTPLPNRPRECYTLARGMAWEAIDWASYDDFCYRYNPSEFIPDERGGAVREEVGRLGELYARLRAEFMVRRLKRDVLPDLPDLLMDFVFMEPNGEVREVMRQESFLDVDPARIHSHDFVQEGHLSTLRREMGEAKAPIIVDYVRHLLDVVGVHKLALFAHHRSVMDTFASELAEYGVAEIRGGMSGAAKERSKMRFVDDPDVRVLSGQLDASGTGMDGIQEVTSRAVIAEPAWAPGVNEQVGARLHRYGQPDSVLVDIPVFRGSLDHRVVSRFVQKAHNIDATIDRRRRRDAGS